MFGVGKKFDIEASDNFALRPIQQKNIENNLFDISTSSNPDINSAVNIMQKNNTVLKQKKSSTSISNTENNKQCICDRNSSTIFCAACEKFSFGRVKMACPMHYNVSIRYKYVLNYYIKYVIHYYSFFFNMY